ncbi:putative ABC transporter ATP-binding protein [Sporomusa silvacetica DSM 10669]|uniref:ABC transporter ATP-binding protein n=1 Tax=Sporomusa silvacetica DSM 10669 TaxID=1123289 RepID=A0ABZ3IN26_9FIRM|nr:ABC transporter ATP-binding protein [Sporomusa silvacetica]OZC14379.1 putative ABC transporter ATP-binding protein [Sporomusa silvacetica DSM 10669]
MGLEVRNATFAYNEERTSFQNISFSVSRGEVMCLLGPNGAGKSTLIKCLNRLLVLRSGAVLLDGHDISNLSRQQLAKKIAYVPQSHIPAFPYSVINVVLMGRTAHLGFLSSPGKKDRDIAEQALDSLGITHLANKPYTQISGGERQLVLLAAVLAQEPEYLLLDEPTSHLDFGNQTRLLEVINRLAKQGIAVIMSSHFPDHAFFTSGKVVILKEGSLVDIGSAADVITEKNIRDTYGIEVLIGPVAGRHDVITCVPVMNKMK